MTAPSSRSVLSTYSTYRWRPFAMCSVRATLPVSRLWCRTSRSRPRPRSPPTLTMLLRPVICLVAPIFIGISIVRPPCLPSSTSSGIEVSSRRLGSRPRIFCTSRDPTLTLVLVSLKARFTTPLVSGMNSHYFDLVTSRRQAGSPGELLSGQFRSAIIVKYGWLFGASSMPRMVLIVFC